MNPSDPNTEEKIQHALQDPRLNVPTERDKAAAGERTTDADDTTVPPGIHETQADHPEAQGVDPDVPQQDVTPDATGTPARET